MNRERAAPLVGLATSLLQLLAEGRDRSRVPLLFRRIGNEKMESIHLLCGTHVGKKASLSIKKIRHSSETFATLIPPYRKIEQMESLSIRSRISGANAAFYSF